MKTSKLQLILFPILLILSSQNSVAQVSQGFESNIAPTFDSGTNCWFLDNDLTAHTLVNQMPSCGLITVQETGTRNTLGYSIDWMPSGNGPDGFSDGDNFGVINSTTFTAEFGTSSPIEGSQVFSIEDSDGDIRMTFDPVDLSSTSNTMLSMDYFINSSGYEAADFLRVILEITGCGNATSLTVLDVDGDDIDNGVVAEEQWNALNQDLSIYSDCTCQLIIEASTNASSEQFAIDDIQFTEGVVLPVELVQFEAKHTKQGVQLHWQTASEQDNDYFLIEKSKDAKHFEMLGEVVGTGTTLEPQKYTFLDAQIQQKGQLYYRLKQVDFDGDFEYSSIVAVKIEPKYPDIRFYPTVVKNELFIELEMSETTVNQATITFFNMMGKELQSFSDGRTKFDLHALKNGHYIVTIQFDNQVITKRFIKI